MKTQGFCIPRWTGLLVLVLIGCGIGSQTSGHEGHHRRTPDDGSPTALKMLEERVRSNPTAVSLSRLAETWLRWARSSAEHAHYRAAEDAFRRWIVIEESNQAVAVHARTLASDASFALRNRGLPRSR